MHDTVIGLLINKVVVDATFMLDYRFHPLPDLFITPGYEFNSVDAMLTNFHLPESTLLMLVSAFAGHQAIMDAYQHAIDQYYRFFSYGDAMFLSR